MPVRKILKWPNKSLKKKSENLNEKDDLDSLIKDLEDTMKSNFGLGIAAPQINIHKKAIVIKAGELSSIDPEEKSGCIVLLNPSYTVVDKKRVKSMESCLSVTGYMDQVERYESIELDYQDTDFKNKKLVLSGRDSCIVQHEIDHLDGILFIDRLSQIRKSMFVKKYNKQMRKFKNLLEDKEKKSKQKALKTRSINRKKRKSKK
tara:strand:+ start:1033 stop:1644 length:612 start_codon:yes stop_codon:yes gene_type:complete